jgi:hypothetical protein
VEKVKLDDRVGCNTVLLIMVLTDYLLAAIPLAFPAWYLVILLDNPMLVVGRWFNMLISSKANEDSPDVPPVGSQLLAYVVVALFGYGMTNKLVPNIKVRCAWCNFFGRTGEKTGGILIQYVDHIVRLTPLRFAYSNILFEKGSAGKTWGSVAQPLQTNRCKQHNVNAWMRCKNIAHACLYRLFC